MDPLSAYKAKLETLSGWDSSFFLRVDPHRGRIFVEQGDKIHLFHRMDPNRDELNTSERALKVFDLDPAESLALTAAFAASA